MEVETPSVPSSEKKTKKKWMRAAVIEEELEQKICHSGESIRDATQKSACPRPDPGVQLGCKRGVADLRWKVLTRGPPELGGARGSLQLQKPVCHLTGRISRKWLFYYFNSSILMMKTSFSNSQNFSRSPDGIHWTSATTNRSKENLRLLDYFHFFDWYVYVNSLMGWLHTSQHICQVMTTLTYI